MSSGDYVISTGTRRYIHLARDIENNQVYWVRLTNNSEAFINELKEKYDIRFRQGIEYELDMINRSLTTYPWAKKTRLIFKRGMAQYDLDQTTKGLAALIRKAEKEDKQQK